MLKKKEKRKKKEKSRNWKIISFSIVDVHSTSSVLGVLPISMDTFWHEALLGRVGKFQERLFVLLIWSIWKEQN